MSDNNNRAARGEKRLSPLETGDSAHSDGAEAASLETQAPVVEPSWDPYQVWLTRVKQPREQVSRMRRHERLVADQPSTSDLSDTARLRALTIVP